MWNTYRVWTPHDPFEEEEEDDQTFLLTEEIYAIISGDFFPSNMPGNLACDASPCTCESEGSADGHTGAYLSGILHETMYMTQPEGYNTGTD
jgi:hypothetical protein